MATTPPSAVDLTTCDREPIHLPGSIQPFGILLVLDVRASVVVQVSANVEAELGRAPSAVLGMRLADVLGPAPADLIQTALADPGLERNPRHLGTVAVGVGGRARSFHAIAHRIDGIPIVELEQLVAGRPASFQDFYLLLARFLEGLEHASTLPELCRLSAAEVRRITGFDRVLVYRFDEDEKGTVIAEDRNEVLPSYLDLRFPATDIPRQARELYRVNRFRLIADASYQPVPIVPALDQASGRPVDLTYANLRSVSPVHVEYMRNMGTMASMSVSILLEGRLWGLISCHHRGARLVPFEVRTACDTLGRLLAMQIASHESRAEYERRAALQSIATRLLAGMAAEEHYLDGLVRDPADLLAFASAEGAAVVYRGECRLVGNTPAAPGVLRLVDWLSERGRADVFQTDRLAELLPEHLGPADPASGLLAIPISKIHRSYVLWFRPEVVRTVRWGGDPSKPVEPPGPGARIHPRKSFELWKETVRGRSSPWHPAEVAAAAELRHAILGIVLRKAEELAQVSAELERSNRELEAFSYSVSHDLRAPLRHIVGYSELLLEEPDLSPNGRRYASTVIESAQYAGTLVDNLLAFSQMGRTSMHPVPTDMGRLVEEVRLDVETEAGGRAIRWEVGPLPTAQCDPIMMRLAVRNLLSNAVKFTRNRDEAVITIGAEERDGETVYCVRDNGIGFDMKYVDKLFGVFQRLHRMEDFEGTGIGLANVRRIIERHGGRAWAEGALDSGATFYFSLPAQPEPEPG